MSAKKKQVVDLEDDDEADVGLRSDDDDVVHVNGSNIDMVTADLTTERVGRRLTSKPIRSSRV